MVYLLNYVADLFCTKACSHTRSCMSQTTTDCNTCRAEVNRSGNEIYQEFFPPNNQQNEVRNFNLICFKQYDISTPYKTHDHVVYTIVISQVAMACIHIFQNLTFHPCFVHLGKLTLAEDCLIRGRDLPGLMLLATSRGSRSLMDKLASIAKEAGKNNIAFSCFLMLGKTSECIDILIEGGRMPEAAFFARTYAPAQVSRVVGLWREDLKKVNPKVKLACVSTFRCGADR